MEEGVSGADDGDDAACAVLVVFAYLEFHVFKSRTRRGRSTDDRSEFKVFRLFEG